MRIDAVIQARMGSTRLPGKVLMDVAGEPMVTHVVRRAAAIEGVGEVLVAIPDLAEDDLLAETLAHGGVPFVRGSAADVLGRFRLATEALGADAIVRITADCPVLSPEVSTLVVREFLRGSADYCSNTLERSWPRGMDTEVVSAPALFKAAAEAVSDADREHVTPFIWRHPNRFRLRSVTGAADRSSVRLTVDTEADLQLIRTLYAELGREFELSEIVDLLDRRPELRAINASVRQKPPD
jgi:spore coat polysaccharide biosynthesis protein SpsF